jgi:L-fuculose-phosphate aldolase
VETGLVQGTWGNLSIRLDNQYMLVTPSGLDYSRLTAEDMVKVDMSTMKHEGGLKPTSEKGLHAAVYKQRPDIGAVVHTHSRCCSIFAAAHADLNLADASDDARAVFGSTVHLAKYAKAGTDKLAKNTVDALGRGMGAIMANHGMIACGADMETAFTNCQLLEKTAGEYIESRL